MSRFSMKFSGIESTFATLALELRKQTDEEAEKTVKKMTAELRSETPVDTGNARDSWSTTKQGSTFIVQNDAEYIANLNDGSSKQAPAHFIESVALKYGTPLGSIVESS